MPAPGLHPRHIHTNPRKRSERPSRLGVYDDRSEEGKKEAYFLAMNVYLPSSSDSLSIQITVHLPSPLNLAFTAPFFVSYTAHTSSDFSETLHSYRSTSCDV